MPSILLRLVLLASLALPVLALGAEPQPVKHQVTGLFCPERQKDLQEICRDLPGVALKEVDYDRAEATFVYDPAVAFPNARPEQIIERFDNLLRNATRHTFGIKPLCESRDQLQRVEIKVAGLDCKGCSFGAYDAIYRLEGVEQATASFREGRVVAWIHPGKIDRAALEAALTKRGVKLAEAAAP